MTEGRKLLLNQCVGLLELLSDALDQIEAKDAECKKLAADYEAVKGKLEVLETVDRARVGETGGPRAIGEDQCFAPRIGETP